MFLAKGAAHGKALGWECAQRAVQRPAKRRVLGVGVREARDRSGRSESYKSRNFHSLETLKAGL